jgi:hypothetical protein
MDGEDSNPTDTVMKPFTRYEPRPVNFLGIREVSGMRLKTYTICLPDATFAEARFSDVWELTAKTLPQQASESRPNIGFAIQHQGRTGDYFVLGWWDNENELPLHVFVGDQHGWRKAQGGESVCVWDLRVIWWERELYVNTMMAGHADGVNAYLTASLQGYA